ncbi:unnamed protein product [Gongylonema pulchrum]|uniref:Myosin motor domain-containing protein n=1 Tax=Gongylonema pulchrum TaxID=637853 RepID=A0A183DZU3_9BILA|nr:unnamed protein product [Gongylonema pulchrum]
MRGVAFLEPVKYRAGPPRPNDIRYGLLPGDQLLRINGTSIDAFDGLNCTKRMIAPASLVRVAIYYYLFVLLQRCGPTVELTVKSTPELAELCERNETSRYDSDDSLLLPVSANYQSNTDIADEQRYWLIHKNGFTFARLLETLSDGRMRIRVMDKLEMIVDVTDVDKANPAILDRCKDIVSLRYINETSVLHVLRQRYGSNLFYTCSGPRNMICLAAEDNPATSLSLFRGCRRQQMPPHIYSSAQQAYRALQMSGRSQCVVLTGTSGSGKTTQLRNLCRYFCDVAGWTKHLSYDVISSALFVMESFGNCVSKHSSNSTRFVSLFSLSFDTVASLRCASVQTFLLEKTRICRHLKDGMTFHVVRYLLQGTDPDTHATFLLNELDKQAFGFAEDEDSCADSQKGWSKLSHSFATLGFSDNEKATIISLLAAILHLICAGATQGDAQRSQFVCMQHAQHAATLLGVEVEQIASAVFRRNLSHGGPTNPVSRFSLSTRNQTGQEALSRFIACLYNELFGAVVRLLNRRMGGDSSKSASSITIIDYPGSTFGSSNSVTHPALLLAHFWHEFSVQP